MATQIVGVREFRENLSSYIESDAAVAITRHGDAVGVYIPAPRKSGNVDWEKMEELARLVQKDLAAAGLTAGDVLADFTKWRKENRK